jgi:hypothetical protein
MIMSIQAGSTSKADLHTHSIVECRELIGAPAGSLTDAQVLELRAFSYRIAEAIYARWLRSRSQPRAMDSRK